MAVGASYRHLVALQPLTSEAERAHIGGRTRAHRRKLAFGGAFFPDVRASYSRSVSPSTVSPTAGSAASGHGSR